MFVPERQQRLEIEESADYQTKQVHFDPFKFTRTALREIIRYQIFSAQPKEFIIVGEDSITFISFKLLKGARRYFGEERREFLDLLAEKMINARMVTVKSPVQNRLFS